jgi:hypothetical protein
MGGEARGCVEVGGGVVASDNNQILVSSDYYRRGNNNVKDLPPFTVTMYYFPSYDPSKGSLSFNKQSKGITTYNIQHKTFILIKIEYVSASGIL